MEKAFSIDMFVPPNWEFQIGLSHSLLLHFDEAIVRFNRAIERAPKFFPPYMFLACAYVELDRLDDAKNTIKTFLEITPEYTLKSLNNMLPFRVNEVRDRTTLD